MLKALPIKSFRASLALVNDRAESRRPVMLLASEVSVVELVPIALLISTLVRREVLSYILPIFASMPGVDIFVYSHLDRMGQSSGLCTCHLIRLQ